MFQYVLALLLINTYYQSLGDPLPQKAGNNSISDSLRMLVKQCENKILTDQILSKIQECEIPANEPHSEQQLHCIMYYDINKQLCSAVASSKLGISEDYAAKINELQDIHKFCTSMEGSVFLNLPDYPFYKDLAEGLFNRSTYCNKACGYGGLENMYTNYYCKYYKWGADKLSQAATTSSTTSNSVVSVPETDNSADIHVNSATNVHELASKTANPTALKVPEVQIDALKATPDKTPQAAKSDISNPEIKTQLPKQTAQDVNNGEEMDPNFDNMEVPKELLSSTEQALKPAKDVKTKLANEGVLMPVKDDQVNTEQKDGVLENPAKSIKDMDYPGSEEDKNDNPDEDDDPLGAADFKDPEITKDKISSDKNPFDIPKGYSSHSEPEEFAEESDNFFPFFLTAVILVVLLYVLYHNKSKVTKVFFGLVLEGRQGSRRRNSRGHAYRRLDTLEQAMSANTAAPPSKIIY